LLGLQLRFPQKVLLQMNTVRLPALFTPSQQQPLLLLHSRPLRIRCSSQNGAILSEKKKGPIIAELPLEQIRRPLLRTRNNNPEKVQQLMDSIADIGLQEPVSLMDIHYSPNNFVRIFD
jgi:sulfiredoxin